jgi:AcrR family transcriptional regulator
MQELLDKGAVELERVGSSKLTLRSLARSLGVSHNAPYRHFATIDEFFAHLAARGLKLLAKSMRDASAKAKDLREFNRSMANAYVRFVIKHPQLIQLMFGGIVDDKTFAQIAEPVAKRTYGEYLEAYAHHATCLSPDEVRDHAFSRWAHFHGIALLGASGLFEAKDLESKIEAYLSAMGS